MPEDLTLQPEVKAGISRLVLGVRNGLETLLQVYMVIMIMTSSLIFLFLFLSISTILKFVQKVADGRGMEFDEVAKIAEGHFYTGTAGKEIGLVDELGGLEKSIDMALEAAGIDPDSRWELIELPNKGLFDPAMFTPKLLGLKGPIYEMLTTDDPEIRYFRMMAEASGSPLVLMDPDIIFSLEYMDR